MPRPLVSHMWGMKCKLPSRLPRPGDPGEEPGEDKKCREKKEEPDGSPLSRVPMRSICAGGFRLEAGGKRSGGQHGKVSPGG